MKAGEILVVEDEHDILELIVFLLTREGYTVHSASSVESALLTLTQVQVDVVLTDYMMPNLDGADLLRTMRASPELANIPVLVLSAAAEDTVRHRCHGIAGFLGKPFPVEALLTSVQSVLSRSVAFTAEAYRHP